ncbi:MAG: phytanoyl-CoA dioxygenase family protein [Pseudomonadota bacterium]
MSSEPSRSSTEALAHQFWRDGYLLLEHFFADPLMATLDTQIRDHFGANPAFAHTDEFLTEAQTEVIPWFPQHDGAGPFDEVDRHSGLAALTDAILGAGWRSDYCMVMFSREGSAGQAWHQDCPPEIREAHNLNRLLYTRNIDPAAGGQTVVVPGSHRRGSISVGDPTGRFPDQRVITPTQGALLLLHGHTWHRVLPVTRDVRYSTNYRALPAAAPDGVTDVCVYRNMRYRFSTASVIEQREAR